MKEWDDSIVDFAAPIDGFTTRAFGGRSGPLALDNGAALTFPWQAQQEIVGAETATIRSSQGADYVALDLVGPTMVNGGTNAFVSLRGWTDTTSPLIMGDGSGSYVLLGNSDVTVFGMDTVVIATDGTVGTDITVQSNRALTLNADTDITVQSNQALSLNADTDINLIATTGNVYVNGVDIYTSLGAWITTFTPVLKQNGTTVASTTNSSRYVKRGRLVTWSFYVSCTAAGTAGTVITLTLPFATTTALGGAGVSNHFDASLNTHYIGACRPYDTTHVGFVNHGSNNWAGISTPAEALAANDVFIGVITYEATT